ncbi:hypothetical protein BIV57_12590 [Mangrovactinospora gilvigrisea]|uniref:Uncharacterized protein n=1 Tax=Mangrovactinospora gilvigrisea TaxID=1428644 RepID=A0A1J7C6H0_9ACTN|nr:hypothetical protein [Mangrovactinospora gilvigrisea]OIV37160.1 hypothetical protein BIV57_12590 [Mangrovactinospora gilvigrisea]
MSEPDDDGRIRAALAEPARPPLRPVLTPRQIRQRGAARRRRRRLALAAGGTAASAAVALLAVFGGHAGPAPHTAATPRTELDAAHAAVADYYARLPSAAAARADLNGLVRAHLAAPALARAAAVATASSGRSWPAVCGTPPADAAFHVGPLRQTGPSRATALVSGTAPRTVVTVAPASGRIIGWSCDR